MPSKQGHGIGNWFGQWLLQPVVVMCFLTTLVGRGTFGGGSTAKQTCTFKSDVDYQILFASHLAIFGELILEDNILAKWIR